MKLSQLFGLTGTVVVAAAYVPQIRHLWKEHCSAGISIKAYSLWLLASLMFLVHAWMIKDLVFVFVQILNLAATCVIVICCKKFENGMCLTHLQNLKQAETAKVE